MPNEILLSSIPRLGALFRGARSKQILACNYVVNNTRDKSSCIPVHHTVVSQVAKVDVQTQRLTRRTLPANTRNPPRFCLSDEGLVRRYHCLLSIVEIANSLHGLSYHRQSSIVRRRGSFYGRGSNFVHASYKVGFLQDTSDGQQYYSNTV